MRTDKNEAIKLRKEGKSYSEINKILNVSKSTLSEWFKAFKWSKETKIKNNKINIERSTKHLSKMHLARKLILEEKYKNIEKEAEEEFLLYKDDPLFIAGLMVYAGEGDKTNRYNIRVSNSEFYLHIVFIRFSERFLHIGRDKIKFWLLLYPDHNIEEQIKIWSKNLNISKSNFHKSQVIMGKEKIKKLQNGVGNSIISNVALKKKILRWLELYKELFK